MITYICFGYVICIFNPINKIKKMRKCTIINSNYGGGNETLKIKNITTFHLSKIDKVEFIFDYDYLG